MWVTQDGWDKKEVRERGGGAVGVLFSKSPSLLTGFRRPALEDRRIRRGEDGGGRREVEPPVSAIAKLLSQVEQGERGEGERGGEKLE